MERNDNETFSRNLDGNFSTFPDFNIQSILKSVSEIEWVPGQGHRRSRQGQSSRGQRQTGPFQGMLSHGGSQMGHDEGQSGQIQGPLIQGLGNRGQGQPGEGSGMAIEGHNQPGQGPSIQGLGNRGQGQPGEGDRVAIQGHNQPGQGQYHDGKTPPQLSRGQTRPKQGQREPEQSQGLPGHALGLLGTGRGQPNQGLSQPRQPRRQPGQVQEPRGHAWGQLGQGQVGRGGDKPGQGGGETGQDQQGQAQRTLLQARANVTEQHRPRQSPPLPLDGQENKNYLSKRFNSLYWEMSKLNTWKVRVDSELEKKEEALRMAQETIDGLQTSTRETQLENQQLTVRLQDVIDIKRELMEQIRAAREMCDDLKGQSSSVQQTLTRAKTEQEAMEAVHLSLRTELKTFAVTFSDLNLKSQNDKNLALDKVKATVEEMGRAHLEFVNKLTVKESQVKEISGLLELKNEELKATSHKLQDSIEDCVRLKEIKRDFQTRLEQAQEEMNTLKLEVNRLREVASTLQAGVQNTERSLAEKEREFTARTTELQLSRDELQLQHRDLSAIVHNLEKANEELTAAAGRRSSEEAEIRSGLEANIREKNTEIDNLKIASVINNVKHQETLESLEAFKQERASLKETVRRMERQIAAMETLKNESKSELNGMKAKERALENDLKDASKAVNVLESELSQERMSSLDMRNRFGMVVSENEELTELLSRVESQNEELGNIIETTKRNGDSLKFEVLKLESINKNLTEELESAKTHHRAQLEAHIQTHTNLCQSVTSDSYARCSVAKRAVGARRRRRAQSVGAFAACSVSRRSRARLDQEASVVNPTAGVVREPRQVHELAERREAQRGKESRSENKIKELESQVDSLERQRQDDLARDNAIAELADRMEKIKHLQEIKSRNISALTAMVEECERASDRTLQAEDEDLSSLEREDRGALERVHASNKAQSDEMRAEVAKLKEESKQETPPLPAPVTVAKSASKGIRKPLATGKTVNKKRKSPYRSDFESSQGMDLTVDEQLEASASGAMPAKRTYKAGAAGENLGDAEGSDDSGGDDDDADATRASKISRRTASTRKVKRGEVVSALPPSESPAQEWGSIFDWFEGQDVDSIEPVDYKI